MRRTIFLLLSVVSIVVLALKLIPLCFHCFYYYRKYITKLDKSTFYFIAAGITIVVKNVKPSDLVKSSNLSELKVPENTHPRKSVEYFERGKTYSIKAFRERKMVKQIVCGVYILISVAYNIVQSGIGS